MANLRLGSRLLLTGICSVFEDTSGRPLSFRVYLRSADDIAVLETPSRWTGTHTAAALAGMGMVILASIGWGVALRSRVAKQTGIIRQRLENEAALEERYRALVENANDMVFSHDLDGNLTSLNPAGERISGYPAAEALRLRITDLVAPEHSELVQRMSSASAANGHASIYELDLLTKDGRRVPVEISSRFIWDGEKPVGLEGIARDVTVRCPALLTC